MSGKMVFEVSAEDLIIWLKMFMWSWAMSKCYAEKISIYLAEHIKSTSIGAKFVKYLKFCELSDNF